MSSPSPTSPTFFLHHSENHHHSMHNHHGALQIYHDSLTGVDDDNDVDGMHNMLSAGSSTSSTSTMPLLNEGHSFSRISLDEYSPLSLVEDCDNALPISPTCGSHHSFKFSLNNLKMDNLSMGDVDVHDDVNDARSMSPSLLSANSHQNLWSNSSTAITQNTATSFLLSQHHHNQLNSLIQQLEPQSLDEPPPSVNTNSATDATAHRPSSEPPPGANGPESQSTQQAKPKQTASRASKTDKAIAPVAITTTRNQQKQLQDQHKNHNLKQHQKNRDQHHELEQKQQSLELLQAKQNQQKQQQHRQRQRQQRRLRQQQQRQQQQQQKQQQSASLPSQTPKPEQTVHSSKVHLQLNHHKKLQELQQKLFGSATTNIVTTEASNQPIASLASKSNGTNGGDATGTSSNSVPNKCVSANSNSAQTIGVHQIAIQVICQDGTSLVLPVSSTAVSLGSHNQSQLQTVLAKSADQRNATGQVLPLVSVSNIVAQQHATNSNDDGSINNVASGNSFASVSSSTDSQANSAQQPQQQISGLAASSPTLAALLDAGSCRTNNSNNGNYNDLNCTNQSSQNIVHNNLLKRLVSGSSIDLKRTDLTMQRGSTLNLANCGSLVTVCTTTGNNSTNTNNSINNNNGNNHSGNSNTTGGTNTSKATLNQLKSLSKTNSPSKSGEKRIKLETPDVSNLQTTFTLIDPQGLIVARGNEKSSSPNKSQQQQQQAIATLTAAGKVVSSIPTPGNSDTQQNVAKSSSESAVKQSKMGSSTGNRQVDPAQPFRCEHCNSTFTRLGNFTRHKKIHTVPTKDGQRFKCDVCSKSFLQRCDLARHLHIHRGTEPHRCNICGKGYIRHSDLVTHQRFHNKEKPFGCPHCSKGFCQRGDLNRHLRSIHLQMKPILCPCCNRKFAKQETLLRHLNTAHRTKTGTTASAIITELPSNYTVTPVDEKQRNTISVVTTNAPISNNDNSDSNNNNVTQKNAQVASLQAIQATLCKFQQSVDPSAASGLVKAAVPAASEASTTKVVT